MTENHSKPETVADLIASWRKVVREHRLAMDEIEFKDDEEWCLHQEAASHYEACANQLEAITVPAQSTQLELMRESFRAGQNYAAPSAPPQQQPICVHKTCDDTEWCAGEPVCRYALPPQESEPPEDVVGSEICRLVDCDECCEDPGAPERVCDKAARAVLAKFDVRRNQSQEAPAPQKSDEDEAYAIGKRDGYEEAVQELDIFTGGDGEFKGSTVPGGTVDVPAMMARVKRAFGDAMSYADLRASGGIFPEAARAPHDSLVVPLADHGEIGRLVLNQPFEIQKQIVTIAAHCLALTDGESPVDDLAGCISRCCLDLAKALQSQEENADERSEADRHCRRSEARK